MKAKTKPTEKQESFRHLTGHGGLGLVMFFLARKKIDFALTPERSPLGDIWVSVSGCKYGIEVKTCRGKLAWQIDTRQINNVDFYVLVSMDKAECFILSSMEMVAHVAGAPRVYGNVYMVTRGQIDDGALNAWDKIGGISGGGVDVVLRRVRTKGPAFRTSTKTVRKTLADGTEKTYVYRPTHTVTEAEWKPPETDK